MPAIQSGNGINGLTIQDLQQRNEALARQRTAIAAAGEAEITRMTVDEGKRRENSLFGIERGIAASRLEIQRDTAKTGEQQLAAQHAAINLKMKDDLAEVDEKMRDPSIGAMSAMHLKIERRPFPTPRPRPIRSSTTTRDAGEHL
jgi:hypothetical protein